MKSIRNTKLASQDAKQERKGQEKVLFLWGEGTFAYRKDRASVRMLWKGKILKIGESGLALQEMIRASHQNHDIWKCTEKQRIEDTSFKYSLESLDPMKVYSKEMIGEI